MTLVSLQILAEFLNKYKLKGRVADYGGANDIGSPIVRRMLSIKNIIISMGDSDDKVNVQGALRKSIPGYYAIDYKNGYDLMKPIKEEKFDNGLCMDLLEHVENPFVVAKNIKDSLKTGALLFVTTPWIWELHYHPKDYWRFCPQGIEELFKGMKKILLKIARDKSDLESVPRQRIVAVFKKK